VNLDEFEPKSSRPKKGSDPKMDMKLRLSSPAYLKSTTSNAPQVIVKIANNSTTGSGVNDTLKYLTREKEDQPLELEDQDGNQIDGDKESIKELYQEWSQRFEKEPQWKIDENKKYQDWKKENPKKDDKEYEGKRPRMKRQVTHMILSGKVGNNDEDSAKLLDSARDLMRQEFGDKGYDYVMVMHRDSENPHVHVLINNYNREKDRPKLRINKPELFAVRQELASGLQKRGIEVAATLRKDRLETLKDIDKGIEYLHKKETVFMSKIEKAAGSTDAFKHRKYQLQSIHNLERKVKDSTVPLTGERKAYLKDLKDLKKSIMKDDNAQFKTKVSMTIKKLQYDTQEFGDHLKELETPQIKPLSRVAKILRKKAMSRYATNLQIDIKNAQKQIKNNNTMSKSDRKESVNVLKNMNKQLEKMNKQLSK